MTAPPPDQAWVLEGVRLLRAGNLDRAEACAREALKVRRRSDRALMLMGLVAHSRGGFDEAITWHRKAIEANRRDPLHLCNLGRALADRGSVSEAMACFERALKLDPAHEEGLAGLADMHERRGRFEKALAILEPLARAGRHTPTTAVLHARVLDRQRRDDEAIALAEERLADEQFAGLPRQRMLRILGRLRERNDSIDDAFAAFAAANEIGRRPCDHEATRRRFAMLREIFAPERCAARPRAGLDGARAVFVVGLPRCGSTLIEQIVHAHPRGFGAGEIPDLQALLRDAPAIAGDGARYPSGLDDWDAEALARLGRRALDDLARRDRAADRVVNKTLSNFEHLGFLAAILPGARIVHVRRDPADLCLSCWQHDLAPQLYPWTTDLADCGTHFRLCAQMFDFWRTHPSIEMLELDYEALVAEPEAQTRRLIEFVGLPWDDACLRFHEVKRDVATLSYDQVRRPLHRDAVARWRRYGERLRPLLDALEPA